MMLDCDRLLIGLSAHVSEYYGPPCTVPDPNCPGCQMWGAMRILRRGLNEAGAFDVANGQLTPGTSTWDSQALKGEGG